MRAPDQTSAHRKDQESPVAILISGFPRLSETFILNELIELERQGTWMHVFALKCEASNPGPEEFRQPEVPVTFVPQRITGGFLKETLSGALAMFTRQPAHFLNICCQFLRSGKKERAFPLWQSLLRWLWFCRQLQHRGIKRVHAHFAHDPTTMAYWAYRLLKIYYSFTAHARDIYCYPEPLLRHKIGYALWVATCTGYNKKFLQQVSSNSTPIYRIYHGLDLRQFPVNGQARPAQPLILSVGRLVAKKGFDYLLEACARLRDQGHRFQCILVGEGPQRGHLEKKIVQLDLENVVRMPGAMQHDDVLGLYKKASMFVMPSCITEDGDRDGIPNVVLEAMAMKVPVVASEISGIPEVVQHNRTGLLVEQRNVSELAAAMLTLLANPELSQRLGEAGRHKIEYSFSLQSNVRTLKGLLLAS